MKRPQQVRAALRLASDRTDFHIADVKRVCRIPKGRYEDTEAHNVMREVKAVAPFDLWTVWERPGWFTRAATYEVRLMAFYRSAQANATSINFLTQILQRHRHGDQLTGMARVAARMTVSTKELFEGDLPDPGREDSTLMRIDKLIAQEVD